MKKYSIAIIVLIMMAGIVGCGNQIQDTEETGKGFTDSQAITYYTWRDEEVYTTKLVEAFSQEYPEIHVTVKYISDSLTEEEIEELIETEDVDVIGVKSINHVLLLARHGKVADITKKIESSNIDVSYYGNMYNSVSFEGAYYCLPSRKTNWVLIYNKDIFDKEGIDYPGQMTWDEYAELSKRLTKGSGEDKQWGGYFVNWVYDFMAIQEQNYLYDDDLTYIEQSLSFLNRIYNEDESHMTPDEMEQEEWLKTFENGNVAMMPQGEWFVGMILADEKKGLSDVEWDIAPMPVAQNQKAGITWGLYQLASITEKCDNPDAAFAFLEFLCGYEGAEIYAANGMIPAYIDDNIEKIYRKTVGEHNVDAFFASYQIQETPVYLGYGDLKAILEEEAAAYLAGEQTIEETMDHYIQKRKVYYEQKRK